MVILYVRIILINLGHPVKSDLYPVTYEADER
jgi:hypothetical protein